MGKLKDIKDIDFSKVTITVIEGEPDTRTPEQKADAQSALEAWVKAGKGGYTSEQLAEVFELVKPKPYWKDPIDAYVSIDKENILSYAIPFYCGGTVRFSLTPDDRLHVTHPGYWACIGS